MSRSTYVIRDGQLIEKHLAAPLHHSADAPMVIADGMALTLNMADGQHYDSKRAYQQAVRRSGCEIVGNDPAGRELRRPQIDHGNVGRDVKHAIEQVRSQGFFAGDGWRN